MATKRINQGSLRKRDTSVGATKRGATHLGPMKIVLAHPPIYAQCAEKFDLTGDEIFCYGDTIFNPGGGFIPPHLIAHEKVHRRQQGKDVEGWWEHYLSDDDDWRLGQELEAHQVEYREYCLRHKDRNKRALYLATIAGRLASPMYGNIIDQKTASRRIKGR